jgi:predicted ATPase
MRLSPSTAPSTITARDNTVEAKLGKLQALLAPGAQDDDDIALLSELLSLPSSAADLNLSPQRKREKLFEAMLDQLEAEARHQPVLMVFEDAHWRAIVPAAAYGDQADS